MVRRVTPCVGVWIETPSGPSNGTNKGVTPCVGVWIETLILVLQIKTSVKSHPAWVCGLKQYGSIFRTTICMSHPAWVCGLKHVDIFTIIHHLQQSHPAWVCGLKQVHDHWRIVCWNGHTLRGCVDWNHYKKTSYPFRRVTPCVGVWIETENQQKPYTTLWVTPCVGVWIETENILYDFLLS